MLNARMLLVIVSLCLCGCAQAARPATGAVEPSATPPPLVEKTPAAERLPYLQASSAAVHDQPLLEASALPVASPTPLIPTKALEARMPARLVIDAIELEQSVVPVGLDEERIPIVPRHTVGWYELSARPGQGENIVLWGHVLRFRSEPEIPAPFARLHDLAIGAAIIVYDDSGTAHRYAVTRQVIATPDRVEHMLPKGRERLTLISCFGDLVINERGVDMTQRLITIAEPAG